MTTHQRRLNRSYPRLETLSTNHSFMVWLMLLSALWWDRPQQPPVHAINSLIALTLLLISSSSPWIMIQDLRSKLISRSVIARRRDSYGCTSSLSQSWQFSRSGLQASFWLRCPLLIWSRQFSWRLSLGASLHAFHRNSDWVAWTLVTLSFSI